ncbi:MAG: putative Ig domain-containing protein [Synergistaceae bacterium]|nr:putative Ig domain-containing protein [Synergistaceae bacterium]
METKTIPITLYNLPVINDLFKNGKTRESYSDYVTVSGGKSPYTWTKESGTIPPGLSMSPSGNSLYLQDTPSEAGTYNFSLRVKDANGKTASKSFAVTIATAPTITTAAKLPNGAIKQAYSQTLSATGTPSITWTKTGGIIPPGLTLSNAGKISGTLTKAGTYSFTVKASNSAGNDSRTFTIIITQPTISGTFPKGVVKAKYTGSVTVSGGTAPYTWKNSGTIPTGLKLTYSGNKATLSGTPTKAGTFTFKLTATDKNKAAVTKSFTVTITKPAISGTFANGVVKAKYTGSVTVSGGTASYTWKNSGTIPTGLKIKYSGNKATLSGTPTKAGTFTFKLTATDKNKAAVTKSFTVKITQPAISGTFANGVVKAKYTSSVTVSGGTAPYTWKNSGTIPTGLKIKYSGNKATLSGTPTKAGTFTFKLTATDKNKAVVSKSFTVKITEAKSSGKSSSGNGATSLYAESLTGQADSVGETPQIPSSPTDQTGLAGTGDTAVNLSADLEIVSDDILESYEGRDSDLVKVRENTPLRFTVSNWGANVSTITVYVNDNPVDSTVSGGGLFTLPAEIVSGDFKVSAKAQSEAGEIETNELYIIAE